MSKTETNRAMLMATLAALGGTTLPAGTAAAAVFKDGDIQAFQLVAGDVGDLDEVVGSFDIIRSRVGTTTGIDIVH